jgi:hypothetical protein
MKKTVVEWYFTQLWRAPKDKFMWHRILIKAKEMEKERMIEFARLCLNKAKDLDVLTAFINAQKYYNETYEKDA